MAPVSSFQDFAFSGYEAFALNQDIARSYDFRKRNTDPSEAQKVVSKLPSNLKAVAAVLGTVGGVVFLIIIWRILLWYRRRRLVHRSSTPSWGTFESEKVAGLKTLSLVGNTSPVSATSDSKPVYQQSGKWVPQIRGDNAASRTNERAQGEFAITQMTTKPGAIDETPRAQNFPPASTLPKSPEPLIRRISRKLSARKRSRPLPTPPVPAIPPTPSPRNFEKLTGSTEPSPPPQATTRDCDTEMEVDLLPPAPHLAVRLSPSTSTVASLVIKRQVSASSSGRVIPPPPSMIPTGPLPSIPVVEEADESATTSAKADKARTRSKRRPPQLPITAPASKKVKESQSRRKDNRAEVKSTVTTISQTPRSTQAFLGLPEELQPEKSPARSDSFKAVIPSRSASRERDEESREYERMYMGVEREILEMLESPKSLRIVKKKRKKERKMEQETAVGECVTEPIDVTRLSASPEELPRSTRREEHGHKAPSPHRRDPTNTLRIPRLVVVHKLYRPSLPDELHIELDEPLRLLAEFKDGWIAVERVILKTNKPRNVSFPSNESSPTTPGGFEIDLEREQGPERGVIPRFCILERTEFVAKARRVGMKAVVKEVQKSVRDLKGMSWGSGYSTRKGGKKVPFGYMHGEMQGAKT